MRRPPLATRGVCSPIGLDIGSSTIKAVQLRRRGGTLETAASVQIARVGDPDCPIDEREVARIESVLYRRGFAGSRITLAAPRSALFSAEVETPTHGRDVPVDAIVRTELARVQRVEPNSLEHTNWDLPSSGRRQTSNAVMAVGMDRAGLVQTIDCFEGVGLQVVAVDLPGLALARAARASMPDAKAPFSVVADIGHAAVSISVLHDDTLVYEREAPGGAIGRLVRRIADRTGVEGDIAAALLSSPHIGDADATTLALVADHANLIAEDVRASIAYAAHRYRTDPSAVVVACGGGAELIFDGQRGCDVLGTPVQVMRPSAITHQHEPGADDHPAFVLATALAARFDRA